MYYIVVPVLHYNIIFVHYDIAFGLYDSIRMIGTMFVFLRVEIREIQLTTS